MGVCVGDPDHAAYHASSVVGSSDCDIAVMTVAIPFTRLS